MQKGERQTKGTMWFRGQNVPILYGSSRKDIFGSDDWIARGAIQRIGVAVFATGFFFGSIALFVASLFLRGEISENVGGVLGQIFGFTLAVLAFSVACAGMFLAVRMGRGVVRSFYK
jgi:hypothetical protein